MSDDGLLGRSELERAFTALGTLAKILKLSTLSAALDLCERFFPTEPLPPRSRAMLEDLFNEGK